MLLDVLALRAQRPERVGDEEGPAAQALGDGRTLEQEDPGEVEDSFASRRRRELRVEVLDVLDQGFSSPFSARCRWAARRRSARSRAARRRLSRSASRWSGTTVSGGVRYPQES